MTEIEQSSNVESEPKASDSPIGSFADRVQAALIDGGITTVILIVAGLLATPVYQSFPQLVRVFLFPIYLYASVFLFYAIFECSSKQGTPGKQAFRLRVVDMNGRRISFGRASARTLGKILSTLALMIGWLMPLWTIKRQALHDKIAGTLVLKEGKP